MESRPSSSSVAKSPVILHTSASASFHSHLSVLSSSSQRRLRGLSKPDSDQLPSNDTFKSPIMRSLPPSPQVLNLPLHNSEKLVRPKSPTVTFAHWLLVGYCLLSAAFFTTCLLDVRDSLGAQNMHQDGVTLSPINAMPVPYRLSKLLQSELEPTSVYPLIWSPYVSHDELDITACIWIESKDITHLESWFSNWNGPLSIVVASPSPHQSRPIIKQIENLATIKKRAHFHIVKRMPNETHFANSYLNLARLFAPTRFVVLFPKEPFSRIPNNLYRKLTKQVDSLNSSQLATPLVLSPPSIRSNSPIPFSPLSPLLLDQSYPIWCSERFFSAQSREDSWAECLWQFWLNEYGHLPTLAVPGWKNSSTRNKNGLGVPTTSEETIHRRLSNRFRRESCVLAAKRLKDRATDRGKPDPRKAQWLRKTCRQDVKMG